MFRIGIIGCGKMAASHLKALAEMPDVSVTAVCDISPENREKAAAETGAKPYEQYEDMLKDGNLDLALITLPPALHKDCACKCAEYGINIFLEKPMAVNSQECAEIIAACEQHDVLLWVGHPQRYLPTNRLAKRLIDSGKYGKLMSIHETRNSGYPGKSTLKWLMSKKIAGGGIMFNLGAHTIDMARFLSGSEVDMVQGRLVYHGNEVEDGAFGNLVMKNGVTVNFQLSGRTSAYKYEIILYLSEGEIRITPFSHVDACGKDGVFETIPYNEEESAHSHLYVQLRDVIAAVQNKQEPLVSGAYGLAGIETYEKLSAVSKLHPEL